MGNCDELLQWSVVIIWNVGVVPYVRDSREDFRALREVPEEEIATVQVKTSIPTEGWGWEEDTAEVPVHVYAQVLWEMHVRGAVRAYVVVKFMASWRTNTYVVD